MKLFDGMLEARLVDMCINVPGNFKLAQGTGLKADDFFNDEMREVFRVMEELNAAGKTIDLISVTTKRPECLEKVLQTVDGYSKEAQPTTVVEFANDILTFSWGRSGVKWLVSAATELANFGDVEAVRTFQEQLRLSFEDLYKLIKSEDEVIDSAESMGNLAADLEEKIDNPEVKKAIPVSLKGIDSAIQGWVPGRLTYLGGRPGNGKTTLGLNFAEHASACGWNVIFFSNEMSNVELAYKRVAAEAKVDSLAIETASIKNSEQQMTAVMKAIRKLRESKVSVVETPNQTVQLIERICRARKAQGRCDFVVIDYIQMIGIAGMRQTSENTHVIIGMVSRRLKQLARELKIPILCMAQLNRAVDRAGPLKRPTLADLKDCGGLEQDADSVILIHKFEFRKKEGENAMRFYELCLPKNRHGRQGEIDVVADLATHTFRDLRPDEIHNYLVDKQAAVDHLSKKN